MDDMQPDERVISSTVWHDGKCFYVSTINRDSSAMLGPGRFAETMVWEFDWKTQKRGDIVGQDGGCKGSITKHLLMCQRIHDTGRTEDDDEA